MDQTDIEMRSGSLKMIVVVAACAVVLMGAFLYLWLGGTQPPPPPESGHQENMLAAARDALVKKDDYNTCRNALEQLNRHYAQTSKEHPSTLDKPSQEKLQKLCALEPDELAEISGDSYTRLDEHYLDQCFLMRDAVRPLEMEVRSPSGKTTRLTPLEQAASVFAWVVREVRLQEGIFPQVPPQFALRRGWGTAMDRALIFLALLEQLGNGKNAAADAKPNLVGCLVTLPEQNGQRLWACGVVIENEPKVYLFDPRLGLPLPGPNGKGVATLEEVRKDPAVLAQLKVKDAVYDVTPEQTQKAELYLPCPLSALAPRLHYLQEKVLAPANIRVTLARDVQEDEKRLKAAAGEAVPVKVEKTTLELLRMFLPKDEGGVNKEQPVRLNRLRGFVEAADPTVVQMPWKVVFVFELAPWPDLPGGFRDQAKFPFNIGLGQTVRARFLEPFRSFALEPDHTRDEMLRGHYSAAVQELQPERELRGHQVEALEKLAHNDPKVEQKVKDWLEKAQKAYARQLRARGPEELAEANKEIEQVWQDSLIDTLLNGAVARTRHPETTYYLALCKHEIAEQAQARLELAARAKGESPGKAKEWTDALDWWQRFEEYPDAPEREAARRLHGRAQWLAGDPEAAIKIWEGDAGRGATHSLEKLACLYLAQQARKK
jgi:hypothetical protein